jgi:HlyD family secretion protein
MNSASGAFAIWPLLCLATVWLGGCGLLNDRLSEQRPSTFETEIAEIGDIREIIPAVGPVRAATEVEVGAEVTGRILEVHADFNEPVEAGDLLARIDPAPFQSAVAQARAQLAAQVAASQSAQATLDEARAQVARLSRLAQGSAARQVDLETAQFRERVLEAELQRSQAGVDLAREALRRAEIDLERTAIRAPVDGFVLDRRVEAGQAVNALQSAPTVFVIASSLDRMLIEASVPEADINRIDEDMAVRATVDADPGRYFSGTIEEIRRAPVVRGRFVSYVVIVEARNRSGTLLPGMTASVEFVRAEAREVLRIPIEALYFRPRDFQVEIPAETLAEFERRTGQTLPEAPELREATLAGLDFAVLARQGLRRVFVLTDQRWEPREIRIGGEDQTHVEVVEGLEAGDQVIIGNGR